MTTSTTPEKSVPPAPAGAEPFQFRIRDLLLLMLTVALGAATWAQASPLLFFAFAAATLSCLYLWRRLLSISPVQVVLVVSVLGILAALFLPAVQTTGHRPRHPCANNLKQIVIALHNYHDTYGSLPPAYVADKNGRLMHSWRVLILPFLEEKALYDQYRFDEPWDGLNNRKLADRNVRLFCCPSDHPQSSTETSYVAVIGPHTAWPGEKTLSLADLADGTASVLLVVEVHDSGIHWMDPRDLHVTQMAPSINATHGQGISSHHLHGANAGFADGHVQYLDDSLPADVLRSWINIDDGTLPEPPRP